ncbi:hypothetical protein ONE63_011278 [Megalurothrips usitatus]|uniref:Uncharacterized protein n=1 Tax=Megalurothrips usitatus TaxID=439358 RepID=A0AAV7X2A5_9NEOP|nr:hypothetical protein ONE63_011278 [Megalurothrips usitatus]
MAAVAVKGRPAAEHPGGSLGRFLLAGLRRHERLAIPAQVDSDTLREMSFAEVLRQSVRAAEGWRALGLTSSDTLAVFCPHNHYLYPAFFGAILEGISVAIIKHSTPDELRRFLALIGPKAVLTEPAGLGVVRAALGAAGPGLLHVVAAATSPDSHALSVPDLMAKGAAADPETYRPGDVGDPTEHVAFLLFSSGSSGLPKMVHLSDYSFTMTLLCMRDWLLLPGDRMFITSQLSWATGLTFTLVCAIMGATRVYGWFGQDASRKDWLEIVQRVQVTAWFVPPAGLTMLAAKGARAAPALRSLRVLLTSGSGLHADAQRRLSALLDTPVVQWYGITEVGIIAADGLPARPGSSGRPAPGVHIRLVDADSGLDLVAPNAIGEIRVTSPAYMSGYHNNEIETSQCLDDHGFFRTGDLAYLDEDGYLYLVDRIKDQIKFENMGVAPAELEALLLSHPAVRDACVVGRPYPLRLVDVAAAFVVRQADAGDLTDAELGDIVADHLSYEKWLYGGVFFREEIPITPNGKPDRLHLREWIKTLPPLECSL